MTLGVEWMGLLKDPFRGIDRWVQLVCFFSSRDLREQIDGGGNV